MARMDPADVEFFPVKSIGLRSLQVDMGIQSRVEMAPKHVMGIVKFLLERGPISEPIIVFFDGHKYWVADGFHRVEGHRQASREKGFDKYKEIMCEVRHGTRDDAIAYSAAANQEKTYLKRTPKDIEKSIELLFAISDWWAKSDRVIGDHVGCGHSLVRKVRVRYRDRNNIEIPDKLVRSNGVLYPSSQRPQPKIDRVSAITRNSKGEYVTHVAGKPVYLGRSEEVANARREEIKESNESEFTKYEQAGQVANILARRGISCTSVYEPGAYLGRSGIYGANANGIAVTWEPLRDKSQLITAVGRVVGCRSEISSSRAVVLCPVRFACEKIMAIYKKAGIEFMTIEEFAASVADKIDADENAA